MKKRISMVVTDMDGTLLNDKGAISNENINAIKELKQKNIAFTIATGRGREALIRYLYKYEVAEYVDFIISMNGVGIYDVKSKQNYDFDLLDRETIREIYLSFKHMDVSFAVHDNNTLICSKRTKYTDIECDINNYDCVEKEDFLEIITKDYPKLMLIGEERTLDEISLQLGSKDEKNYNHFKCFHCFLEFVKINVSKGNALTKLCNLKNFDIHEVAALGDNLNDLDMIKYAGLGIAMGNSSDEIKKHANLIALSNNEHGFAHSCREILKSN